LQLGSCSRLTILSLRTNNLSSIPDEIGRIPNLHVLNLSDNKLRNLPFGLMKLKHLTALWLADNQVCLTCCIECWITKIHLYNNYYYYSRLWPFIRDYLGEPVPEETFTYLYLLWSSIILYLLSPSTTIHSILPVQFTYLAVFQHNLSPCPLWSASWSGTLHFTLNTFLHSIIVFFLQHMPAPMQSVLL